MVTSMPVLRNFIGKKLPGSEGSEVCVSVLSFEDLAAFGPYPAPFAGNVLYLKNVIYWTGAIPEFSLKGGRPGFETWCPTRCSVP